MNPVFSIIVPSYNQPEYIEFTCRNLTELKSKAAASGIKIEILLYDNCSNEPTQLVIKKHVDLFDVLVIEKDKGQYDAINKGIQKCSGTYWTWLNTDDLLDIDGFIRLAGILDENDGIDYIYGSVMYIDEQGNFIKTINTYPINMNYLITKNPAIFQPGSFFKKSFTNKIGNLLPYACCFDYEYILRALKYDAVFYQCDFIVSKFRYYSNSKTGSNTVQFIKEQLMISRNYGRKWFHFLSLFSFLRLVKHFLFPRK